MGKSEKAEPKKRAGAKGRRDSGKEEAIFETAEEFSKAAQAYFDEADRDGRLYGEAGLCLGLSRFNPKGGSVSIPTLRRWYDKGSESCPGLQEAVQMAYLRIQEQIETSPVYMEKSGMNTRALFLLKQRRFGGYQEKPEAKSDVKLEISFGKNMDQSDFE